MDQYVAHLVSDHQHDILSGHQDVCHQKHLLTKMMHCATVAVQAVVVVVAAWPVG